MGQQDADCRAFLLWRDVAVGARLPDYRKCQARGSGIRGCFGAAPSLEEFTKAGRLAVFDLQGFAKRLATKRAGSMCHQQVNKHRCSVFQNLEDPPALRVKSV